MTRCFSNCYLCAGFLQPFGSPRHKPCWFSKPCHGAPLTGTGPSGQGSDPSLFCSCDIPPTCESLHGKWWVGWVLTRLRLYISYLCQCGFFFTSIVVENLFFRSFLEIVVLYVFVVLVSMRGGVLRTFLLCHLVSEARSLAFGCQFSLSMKYHFLWLVHCPCNVTPDHQVTVPLKQCF